MKARQNFAASLRRRIFSPIPRSGPPMNQPETPESPAEDEARTVPEADAGEAAAPAEPEPEPWTPDRVLEWNRYYDLYLAGGVLLLVFVTAVHTIASPLIWPLLEAG